MAEHGGGPWWVSHAGPTKPWESSTQEWGEGVGDELVICGVNHEATGKATNANFALYEVRRLFGVLSVDSGRLAGSAADYLPGHPLVDRLYAWSVKRSCGAAAHCSEVIGSVRP